LSGLQRVQYVFVFPDQHDIVLAGPAEGWKINDQGEVVGDVSGRPTLQLDDLVVALRCADQARNGGLTCSIDPTPEGMQRVSELLSHHPSINGDIQPIAAAMEQASGPQKITLHGLPENSRFANVLVSADYLMKRLGMNLDPSPVKGMTSYLELVSPNVHAIQTPRWWLAPKYEPLATDGQGLAWELRGPGVQCMAEEDFFSNGQRQQTGKANPLAQKWADSMTNHYDELSAKIPVFGDLRNCMDLAVVGALIQKACSRKSASICNTCSTTRCWSPAPITRRSKSTAKSASSKKAKTLSSAFPAASPCNPGKSSRSKKLLPPSIQFVPRQRKLARLQKNRGPTPGGGTAS
jgi:hypothetical protein